MNYDPSRRNLLKLSAGIAGGSLLTQTATANQISYNNMGGVDEFESFQKRIAETYNERLQDEGYPQIWELFDVEATGLDEAEDKAYAIIPTDPDDGGPYNDFSNIPEDDKEEFWKWLEKGVKGMVPPTGFQIRDQANKFSDIRYSILDVDDDGIHLHLDFEEAVNVYEDHPDYDPSKDDPLDGYEPIIEDMQEYFTIERDEPD